MEKLQSTLQKKASLSYDDTVRVFQELTCCKQEYHSIFECKELAGLKKLHEQYGIAVSMFCFEETEDFHISQMTDRFREEFGQHAHWLRFGFHGKNKMTRYHEKTNLNDFKRSYEQVTTAIKRFAGEDSLCKTLRIHFFSCTQEQVEYLRRCGVTGLFAADDHRISYHLSKDDNEQLWTEGKLSTNLNYYRTDLRLETTENVQKALLERSGQSQIVVFTHEYVFEQTFEKMEQCSRWLVSNGYQFCFLEDEADKRIDKGR